MQGGLAQTVAFYRLRFPEGTCWSGRLNIAELWHGVRPHEQKALAELFHSLTTLPIDAEVGRRAGEYLRQFAKSRRVELGDALIAATAAIHKVELWTRNRRHYPEKDVEFY